MFKSTHPFTPIMIDFGKEKYTIVIIDLICLFIFVSACCNRARQKEVERERQKEKREGVGGKNQL